MLNLSTILEESAARFPKNKAFVYETTSLDFLTTNQLANQVANALKKLGIQKNDKVLLHCINIPFFPIIYYGILKTGAVVVPTNIMLKAAELSYHLEDAKAKAFFCFTGTSEFPMIQAAKTAFETQNHCQVLIEITPQLTDAPTFNDPKIKTLGQILHGQSPVFEMEATDPNDTAVLLYTSGTTGKPKGAELTHFNLFSNAWNAAEIFDYQSNDVSLIALPLFHSFAQTVQLNAAVKRGSCSILVPKFLPKTVIQKMDEHQVTMFCGVPTMYWALTKMAQDPALAESLKSIVKHLRICCSGGAALPVEDLKNFEKYFGVEILEGYGLSEAGPVVCFNRPHFPRKIGSIGFAIPNLALKVVDEKGNEVKTGEIGELIVRGPNVMKSYFNQAEATAQTIKNHWLYTGDLAKIDEDKYVFIVDRTKDLIIKSGFNVYPREIEEVLLTHPALAQAAVIGFKTEGQGEEIRAFLVLKAEKTATEKEILEFLKKKLANYKLPKEIIFKTELPMNATGKILKTVLRQT